ncbi:hypothetical protein LEN26_018139 [Aphanomyces euteiches]|nr:hypothetical protein LEN26_018139 [Aphanomyces euteiches]KAH9114445.1 hypothetical protein AeMF1_011468 [Aphanomyces euteiches]KAH9187242.1 hypothetical protein AeNC1_010784 [Aphanomyces euteiches]
MWKLIAPALVLFAGLHATAAYTDGTTRCWKSSAKASAKTDTITADVLGATTLLQAAEGRDCPFQVTLDAPTTITRGQSVVLNWSIAFDFANLGSDAFDADHLFLPEYESNPTVFQLVHSTIQVCNATTVDSCNPLSNSTARSVVPSKFDILFAGSRTTFSTNVSFQEARDFYLVAVVSIPSGSGRKTLVQFDSAAFRRVQVSTAADIPTPDINSSPSKSNSNTTTLVCSVAGGVVVLAAAAAFVIFRRRRQHQQQGTQTYVAVETPPAYQST